jgi:cytochrome c oxidase assembly factor CtaG
MGTWLSIATGTTCLIVTIVGLILSAWAWRAKGPRSGLRGVAWSLLPIVMYLTGAIRLVGRLGSAIVTFAGSFVFSPKAWLGVILFFIAALLFLVTGGIPLLQRGRKRDKRRNQKKQASRAGEHDSGLQTSAPSARTQPGTPPAPPGSQPGPADDDLGDVQEILRRRGIR